MNDDQFEETMCMLVRNGFDSTAEQLHARDKAQRQALAQLARLKEAIEDHGTALLTSTATINRMERELAIKLPPLKPYQPELGRFDVTNYGNAMWNMAIEAVRELNQTLAAAHGSEPK